MPGGIEQSAQLRTYYGIQTAKGRGGFKTQSIYDEKQGALAIEHANILEGVLPKHEVRVIPVTKEGAPVGDPIPHKVELPKLKPVKMATGDAPPLRSPQLKAYDLTSGEVKREN